MIRRNDDSAARPSSATEESVTSKAEARSRPSGPSGTTSFPPRAQGVLLIASVLLVVWIVVICSVAFGIALRGDDHREGSGATNAQAEMKRIMLPTILPVLTTLSAGASLLLRLKEKKGAYGFLILTVLLVGAWIGSSGGEAEFVSFTRVLRSVGGMVDSAWAHHVGR